jgi:hypothetical protein
MGRRILAITLLIAFASPLAAPLLAATAGPEASLPSCCRTHGAHACAMMHLRGISSGPAFHAPPCPFYPTATTAPRLLAASLAASLSASVQDRRDPAPPASSPIRAARVFVASAHLKRGPPALFA